MAKPNRTHANPGSLKVKTGWNRAEFKFDPKAGGFYVRDLVGKKRFGPFDGVPQARRSGVNFRMDNGNKLAGVS